MGNERVQQQDRREGLAKFSSLTIRALFACAALVGMAITMILVIPAILEWISVLNIPIEDTSVRSSEIGSAEARLRIMGDWYAVILAASAVTFLVWLHRASTSLTNFSHTARRFTPCSAIGWWFVPIMNWFRPYQVMREIWWASNLESTLGTHAARQAASTPLALKIWWGTWLVGMWFGWLVARLAVDSESADAMVPLLQVSMVCSAVSVVSAGLAIWLILRITNQQKQKFDRIQSA